MAKTQTQNLVFISYANRDKSRALKAIGELKARGVLGEHDKLIHTSDIFPPGSSFREQVQKAIKGASKVIILWSGHGVESGWVYYEKGMAEALGKQIFLVVPKGESSHLPRELKEVQVIELEDAR